MKEAQNGGSGVVIYFRKEGRALGEVTKVCLYPLPLLPPRPAAVSDAHANTVPYVESLTAAWRCVPRAIGRLTPGSAVVYNARKRGEDRASDYFKRTENIAGVKDMRFQALMPDILHWLGITKIDRMLSMSK